ncbi:MAG: GNAT family N-acetyltransferase [Bdellovibrionota bacterium]
MDSLFALHLLDSHPEDVDLAQKIFEDSLVFLNRIEGHTSVPDNVASECMESLPQGVSADKKRTFVLISEKGVSAYYEYLVDFPESEICYLGLLLIPEKFQRQGLGRQAMSIIERQFRIVHKARKIKLAYVACNGTVGEFWEKMGFTECAPRQPYEHGDIHSEYVFMEKNLYHN